MRENQQPLPYEKMIATNFIRIFLFCFHLEKKILQNNLKFKSNLVEGMKSGTTDTLFKMCSCV